MFVRKIVELYPQLFILGTVHIITWETSVIKLKIIEPLKGFS